MVTPGHKHNDNAYVDTAHADNAHASTAHADTAHADNASSPASSASRRRLSVAMRMFVACIMVILALPLAAYPFARTQTVNSQVEDTAQTQNAAQGETAEASTPSIRSLSDAGTVFEEHFPFKNQLIDADAHVRQALFGVSNTKQVVVGRDDWIFYGGTLGDYLGSSRMSDRELDNVAYNLMLAQGYAASRGARLVVCFAPNKNTLYPEYMPGSCLADPEPHDIERILPYLEARDVAYVDLLGVLRDQKESDGSKLLYCLRDSHWNGRGALIGANALLDAAAVEHDPHADADFEPVPAVGDIDAMLLPASAQAEPVPELAGGYQVAFVGEDDVTANLLETEGQGSQNLLMFRDSFGNRLLYPMAESFDHATFTSLVPYDMTRIDRAEADVVVIERVERHLDDLSTNPPIMPAPGIDVSFEGELPGNSTVSVREDGPYTVVEGLLDLEAVEAGDIDPDTDIYLRVGDRTYLASHRSEQTDRGMNAYGYRAYIPSKHLEGETRISIGARCGDSIKTVVSTKLEEEE